MDNYFPGTKTIRLVGTETGRLSCTGPNKSNTPKSADSLKVTSIFQITGEAGKDDVQRRR